MKNFFAEELHDTISIQIHLQHYGKDFRAGIWVPARSLLGEVPGFEFLLTFSTIIRLNVWRFLIGLGNDDQNFCCCSADTEGVTSMNFPLHMSTGSHMFYIEFLVFFSLFYTTFLLHGSVV